MKKWFAFALAALMLLSATACGKENEAGQPVDTQTPANTDNAAGGGPILPLGAVALPDAIAFDDYDAQFAVREANPVDERFLDALNTFAYQSAVNILNNGKGENSCFSPLSVYYALAIAASGASGDTQAQLLAALGAEDAQTLSAQCANLFRRLYADNDVVTLKLADSLWVNDSFSPKDAFVQNAVENFYAETFRADLATQEAADAMADWINERTNGKLSPQFTPSDELLMSIINTIYFCDQWADNFDAEQTAAAAFTRADGTTVNCDFMNRAFGNHGYLKGDDYAKTSLYLADGSRMVFVLPDEGASVDAFLSDADKLRAAISAEEDSYGEVNVSLPKFDNSSDLELSDALKAMGVTAAFEEDADFSGITDDVCYIGSVQHQCRVSVNEDGVEAAAYTAILMCGTGMMTGTASIALDRPFLYAIVDSSGAVLFIGACMNPAA